MKQILFTDDKILNIEETHNPQYISFFYADRSEISDKEKLVLRAHSKARIV